MKVVCTSIQDFTNGQALKIGLCEVGNTYTVVDECIGWGKDNTPVDCYVLEEFSDEYVFDKRNFSPLDSDIDETELVTEEFEEKYCVPVNR
jgi:hypothetical protein